ncbi:hypothetical protein [Dehalococcoides mccartyi]|uniref:Uncharacterized protein n=1 Tax=Dehalococcoides mccartyi (strain VS) TaxID=311424 RepID=D2BG86_DEHMV|nr:hypothetical protein [Dehalococcoides mccartyi]ACZ61336.1 hypothetical protein DhcVS_164 [Dehalococcoides mccartyi VS]
MRNRAKNTAKIFVLVAAVIIITNIILFCVLENPSLNVKGWFNDILFILLYIGGIALLSVSYYIKPRASNDPSKKPILDMYIKKCLIYLCVTLMGFIYSFVETSLVHSLFLYFMCSLIFIIDYPSSKNWDKWLKTQLANNEQG